VHKYIYLVNANKNTKINLGRLTLKVTCWVEKQIQTIKQLKFGDNVLCIKLQTCVLAQMFTFFQNASFCASFILFAEIILLSNLIK